MAGKMMKMGIRGKDGTTKPLSGTNEGYPAFSLVDSGVIQTQIEKTGINNGTTVDVTGFNMVTIEVTGMTDGVVRVLGSVRKPASYFFLYPVKYRERVPKLDITGNGIYHVACEGLTSLQTRITTYNEGEINIYVKAEPFTLQQKNDVPSGIVTSTRSGTIAASGRELVYSTASMTSIDSMELTGSKNNLYLYIRARNKNNEFDVSSMARVASHDGSHIADISFSNVHFYGSDYWEIVRYDIDKGGFKMVLKKPILLPNGVAIEVYNGDSDQANASVIITATEYN